ncbi:MAG: multicopper oxidase domain-containing protein [Gemmatimonadaceae bacterium]
MRLTLAFASLFAAAPFLASPLAPHSSSVARATTNDNRTPAGALRRGVLTIHLEVREVEWRPEGEAVPGIIVHAFAERGKPARVPGPLIRVPEGTTIHASITNPLAKPFAVHGLATHQLATSGDTIVVAAGATRELSFTAGAPGTYYYWGTDAPRPDTLSNANSELSGAFVVDPASVRQGRDRVLLIALWRHDPVSGGVVARRSLLRFTINGRTWPNTERLSYALGDTVSFRVINTSDAVHPMHLHGFYFDVRSRGNGTSDSVYSTSAPPYRVVTERLTPGRTFSMTWVPERAGNWLFHCHDNFHVLRNAPLDGTSLPAEHMMHVTNHAQEMMGGLVMGIEVRGTDVTKRPVSEVGRRQLRLVAQRDSTGTDSEPSFGYVLQEGDRSTSATAPLLPGPTIRLKRGEPVTITIVNHLAEATAVHWHGMELESYFDGVADFAGSRGHIAPAIAPGDSFAARFTPVRSGTFMYHPHADEVRQQQAGLTGALLVLDDPAGFDSTHDIVVLLTVPRLGADRSRILINGSLSPKPLDMRAGEHYRLRIVDVHTYRPSMITRLLGDSALVRWRAVAKDGMDLPAVRATERPAMQQIGNGETYDFEFVPTQAGALRFTVTSALNDPLATLPIRVQ